MATERALVVADDLTGAADTGHEFARRGHPTTVTLGGATDDRVVVVDTDSRESSASDAREAVVAAAERWPAALVYKKVDSTLRGNVAAEVAACAGVFEPDVVLFVPAFPANDRVTEGGRHYASGTAVDDAPVDSGENPPQTSSLSELFATTDIQTTSLPLAVVEAGRQAVESRLASVATRSPTPVLVAVDATEPAHLGRAATAASDLQQQVLYVGSAGLARHVELPFSPTASADRTGASYTPRQPALVVAGSTSPVTRAQVAAVPGSARVELPLSAAVQHPATAADRASDVLVDRLSTAGTAVLTTVSPNQDAAPDPGGLSATERQSRIATALARAAADAVKEAEVADLFLTGGAVAKAVLGQMDADGISPTGTDIGAGIPVSSVVGGRADGLRVVTKAGGFGDPRTIRSWLSNCRPDG